MSAKKAETPPPEGGKEGGIALLRKHSRAVVLVVVILAMAGFWMLTWRRVGDRVLESSDYWLHEENVAVTPLPDWVHCDVRAEVLTNLGGGLSINDPLLVKRVAEAFAQHPWVGEVVQVRKGYPARVEVNLIYRKPVCMVVVPRGLLPIDEQSVLLPTGDFSPVEAERYPRLTGISSSPVGPTGTPWGDPRVKGGARVAAALAEAWQELKLERIVPQPAASGSSRADDFYQLFTRQGTRILWGRAPDADLPGEVPAAEKVARLKKYVAENGSLEGRDGPQELDVRSLRSMETNDKP